MLSLRQIEVFRAIMVARTVTGAARLLRVSQPGLSRMLRHTEDRLGFRLFDRVSGRMVPTHEAEVLFAEIGKIFKGVEGLNDLTRRLAAGEDNVFRLGGSPSLGIHLVPTLLAQLRRRFPGIILRFDVLGVGEVADYLVLRQGEYALTVFPVNHPNVESRQIGAGKFMCVLPVKHRLSSKATVAIRDLAADSLISFAPDTPHGRVVGDLYARANQPLKVSVFVRYAETACDFVREGLGVALVDEFTARGMSGRGILMMPLDQPSELPLVLNRAHFAVRSLVSTAFESLLLKTARREFRETGANSMSA